MFIEFSLAKQSHEEEYENLLVVAQERYPGNQNAMIKFLLEMDIISRLCSKLDTQVQLSEEGTVYFMLNPLMMGIEDDLLEIRDTAMMINGVLKSMVYALSSSVAHFTNGYESPATGNSIKHMADNLLVDTFLRQAALPEAGIIPYAFYMPELKKYYPDFISAVKMAVQLDQSQNRGNEAYNAFEEEPYRPLYNDAKIGIVKSILHKNEGLLAQDIAARVLDLLGSDIAEYTPIQRENFNAAYEKMTTSPYSACLLLNQILTVVKDLSALPFDELMDDIMVLVTENRTLLSVLNAYSKHLSWYVKDVGGSTYALLHFLLKNQTAGHRRLNNTALPEDLHTIIESDSVSDADYAQRKRIIITTCYRDDDAALKAVFKQFASAVDYYVQMEQMAKEKDNKTPIADYSTKKYYSLFHNPDLLPDIDFISFRKSLLSQD